MLSSSHAVMLSCFLALVLSCSLALVRLQTRSYISIDCSLRSTYIPLSIADESAKRANKAASCQHAFVSCSCALVLSYSHVIMKSCSRDIQLSCPLVIMLRLSCSVVNIDGLRPSASHYLGSLDFSLACSWTLSLALLLFYSLPLPLCDFVPLRAWYHAIRLS